MPLIYQKIWNQNQRLAVWKQTEDEAFFIKSLAWPESERSHFESLHPKRRLEWLSSRMLICQLSDIQDSSIIIKDSYGKPSLKGSQINISISHTNGYVAAFISEKSIGIDIQTIVNNIHRIAHKYLNLKELHAISEQHLTEVFHLHWGAKEALYKSYGRKQLRYREDIKIDLDHINQVSEPINKLYPLSFTGHISRGTLFEDYSIEAVKIEDTILVYALKNGL